MRLSVIICAYNERETILTVLDKVRSVDLGPGWEKEIIVVDNFSTDGTRELLRELDLPDVQAVFHPRNLGKGSWPPKRQLPIPPSGRWPLKICRVL
jgi:glycosyltransferase involved in cell wall biosynthesis